MHASYSRPAMFLLLLVLFFTFLSVTTQHSTPNNASSFSLSFPLTSLPKTTSPLFTSSFVSSKISSPSSYRYKSSFNYSMALIVSLPIGTPPQTKQLVLDTGSQLSWIQCHKTSPKKPPSSVFDPSLSKSFSLLPCNHPVCKPPVPDFTLPTSCDQNHLCHYSYFYADGTFAQGNLVREKFTFSSSQTTPPLVLGCATDTTDNEGILGMNLGRLSFASQAKISKFSYCVPAKTGRVVSSGWFYLGENPSSSGFQYVNLLTFPQSQRSPNLDPLAYTLPMQGIRIGKTKLNIPVSAFRADASGSGQTMIDSGSEFTYLVDAAYNKVREEIVRVVGPKMKKNYVYGGVADMCFEGEGRAVSDAIGNMVFEFEKGVELVIEKERVLTDVGGGVHCVGIGRSEMLGGGSNIIGNVHQQNHWVEYDLMNKRVGIGRSDCSRLA